MYSLLDSDISGGEQNGLALSRGALTLSYLEGKRTVRNKQDYTQERENLIVPENFSVPL